MARTHQLFASVCLALLLVDGTLGQAPTMGPKTEGRFPPLVLPPGFRATLFACDPLVEYPSVIALGPQPQTLFVAHDYMTGLGTEIVRRDEIRLLRDTDGDGYADQSTVNAGGFNSIQGLAWHAGAVYAMHAPLLTALRDTDGDGVADERRDLLSGLGLPPEKNPTRLHCANGVVVGHDGWLYLALGDNGVDVPRPEGDRLVLQGGGILRCRPDGRDLHIFATGLRNIYDIALDAELNVFVRDNENDGGDYLLRMCHSYFGADHGYPYLYYERSDEAFAPLAEFGRGSSAGGSCYLETAFPKEFHGHLLSCEWGRAVVRYPRQRAGSSFAPAKEIDFASGAAADAYGFKPTDVVVDRDGSLLISDWADGQRPLRGRGRIYRISYMPQNASQYKPDTQASASGDSPCTRLPVELATGDVERLLMQLDSPSYYARVEAQEALERRGPEAVDQVIRAVSAQSMNTGVRARLHAIWALAHVKGAASVEELFMLVEKDPDDVVRAQAVRALADLTDPVLLEHRLEAPRGNAHFAARLAALAGGQVEYVQLEIVVALGRLRWSGAPNWLRDHLRRPDAALAHAAVQTLRRCDNWPDVVKLLDQSDDHPLRPAALRAIADRAEPDVVDGLIERLQREPSASRRSQYADALARVCKKPGPWVYWGYRPGPRPANSIVWERTSLIEQVLDGVLANKDLGVRAATLQRMEREQIPTRIATLSAWLRADHNKERVTDLLGALKKHPFQDVHELFDNVARDREHDPENRLAAVSMLAAGLEAAQQQRLLELAKTLEDGPVLVRLLEELSQRPKLASAELLVNKLDSRLAVVRAAALEAVATLEIAAAAKRLPSLMQDNDPQVRRAAAMAAGKLRSTELGRLLLDLAQDSEISVRGASLESLRQLADPRAVSFAVAALEQPAIQRAALAYLAEFGNRQQAESVTRIVANSRSHEILVAAIHALSCWETKEPQNSPHRADLQKPIALLQGTSGVVLRWSVQGPVADEAASKLATQLSDSAASGLASPSDPPSNWRYLLAGSNDADPRIELSRPDDAPPNSAWVLWSDLHVAEPTRVQFLAATNGAVQVWVNGRSSFQRSKAGKFQPDSDRFDAQLNQGSNRLIVKLAATPDRMDRMQLSTRFRRLGSSAEHERLIQFALQGTGNAERGRELFANAEKSLCIKCHKVLDRGETIGPDLTGIGSRFSRVHLIESILEPSRSIAPSYETIAVALASGQIVTGVKLSEDDQILTLADDQGRRHAIAKTEIDERAAHHRSAMPEGLEKRLTDREFLDLIAYLLAQKGKT